MRKVLIFAALILLFTATELLTEEKPEEKAVEKLPYYEIPEYPETYSAGTVVGRMLDGLGHRYYWATEGLREEDLAFRPSPEARTSAETIDHIYGLSLTIVNAPQSLPNIRSKDKPEMTFAEKRKATLENIAAASKMVKAGKADDMENYKVIFQSDENRSEFPFWNMLNGPIADAVWHTGQIVSFRRSSGNPFPKGVSVFMGKKRE